MKNKIEFIIAQFNAVVGDIDGNYKRIIDIVDSNRELNATKVFIFPELALCGYSPEDLLFREDFANKIKNSIFKIKEYIKSNEYLIIGAPRYSDDCTKVWNSAFIINNKKIIKTYDKQLLPNYGVFDEKRYFEKGKKNTFIEIEGNKIGILICEDSWNLKSLYNNDLNDLDFLISINASPFEKGKNEKRKKYFNKIASEFKFNFIYVNTVGGQDEIVFDGSSFIVNKEGKIISECAPFSEEISNLFTKNGNFLNENFSDHNNIITDEEALYSAIKIGTYDYISKSDLNGVILGLSGGIDSALTLAIANDIFNKDEIEAILLPSIYTSDLSIQLAKQQCEILNINYSVISIEDIDKTVNKTLEKRFNGLQNDVTEENIQSRARGLILMSISNKTGRVLLTTGNKSELAVGYSTLYGDMCGSFAPLKDIYKTEVYNLSKWRNQNSLVIPEAVIERMPTAELSYDQYDIDTLPPYDVLDMILNLFIEDKKSLDDICNLGFEKSLVTKIINMVIKNEYKRRQYSPGVKVNAESFGRDRRFPIVSKFKY